MPVAVERDGSRRQASKAEKKHSRLVLKRDAFDLKVGEQRLQGMFGLEIGGSGRVGIAMTVATVQGVATAKQDRRKFTGFLDLGVDTLTVRFNGLRRAESNAGSAPDAIEYERVKP